MVFSQGVIGEPEESLQPRTVAQEGINSTLLEDHRIFEEEDDSSFFFELKGLFSNENSENNKEASFSTHRSLRVAACNTKAKSFTANQLKTALGSGVPSFLVSKISYGIEFWRVCGTCSDVPETVSGRDSFCGGYGSSATYSGILAIPTESSSSDGSIVEGTFKTVIDLHPTSTSNHPSATLARGSGEDYTLMLVNSIVAASTGTTSVVLYPDYMGYGTSQGQVHKGYIIQQAYATSTIPLWYAAKELMEQQSGCTSTLAPAVLTKGYSEGGYAAVAVADSFQQIRFDIIKVHAGGGPYQVSAVSTPTIVQSIAAGSFPGGRNDILALFGAAYSSSFVDLPNFNQNQDFIASEIRDLIVNLVKAGASESEIESKVFAQINQLKDAVNPNAMAFFQDARSKNIQDPCRNGSPSNFNVDLLCQALQDNDLDAVIAAATYPIQLCHSPSDEVVPFANVPSNIDGNPKVQLIQASGDHNNAGLQCIISALQDILVGTVLTSFSVDDIDLEETCTAPRQCNDDATWFKTVKGAKRYCNWVANKPGRRCDSVGDDGRVAKDACYETCGTSCGDDGSEEEPTNPGEGGGCGDDSSWTVVIKGRTRTCSWVAGRPSRRCSKQGTDGRVAKNACYETCGTAATDCSGEPAPSPTDAPGGGSSSGTCQDDSNWTRTVKGRRRSCAWVASSRTARRCKLLGDDGTTLASEACLKTCNTCASTTSVSTADNVFEHL